MTNSVETPVFDELLASLSKEDALTITAPRPKWNFAEADARLRPEVEKALLNDSFYTDAAKKTSSQVKAPVKAPRNTAPRKKV